MSLFFTGVFRNRLRLGMYTCDTNGNPIWDDPGGTSCELFQKHKRRKTNSMASEFSTSDSKFLETDTVTGV